MPKLFMKKFYVLILCTLLFLFNFSCKEEEAPSPEPRETAEKPAEPAEGIRQPTKVQGLITFVSGEVDLYNGSDWKFAEIGEVVGEGYAVRTMENSSCEVQFGQASIIRLKESTDLTFSSILFDPGNTNVELKISKGTLLSKVEKLASGDSYNVSSPGVICGIRGTQFLVSTDQELATTVAVREGKVSLIPLVTDPEKLGTELADTGISAEDIFEKIRETAPLISGGEELTLKFAVIEPHSITEPEQYAGDIEILQAEIAARTRAVLSELEVLRKISPGNEKTLEEFAGIEYIGVDQAESEEEAGILETLETLRVHSVIPGTSLTLNGVEAGIDSFSALLPRGTTAVIGAFKEGYEPIERTVSIEEEMEVIELVPEQLEEDTAAVIPEYTVEVTVTPANARLFLDAEAVGTGNYSGSYTEGTKLSFRAEAESYSPRSITFTVTDEEVQKHSIVLPKTIERVFRISYQKLIGELAAARNGVYAADAFGVLSAYSYTGEPLWKVSTGNSPNEYSFPAVGAGRVFLSGSLSFYIVNAQDGTTVYSKDLTGPEMHLFGRQAAVGQEYGFYPANEYIDVFNPANGESLRQIIVSEGLRMTPALYRDQVVVVNTAGELISINRDSGEEIFSASTGAGQLIGTGIKIDGNKAFFIDKNATVSCFDLSSRSVIWQTDLSEYGIFSVLDGLELGDKGVYAYSQGTIVGLDRERGKPLFPVIQNAATPPGYYNGNIYFGTKEMLLQETDAVSGKAKRRINLNHMLTTRPVSEYEKLFIGTEDGMAVIINP